MKFYAGIGSRKTPIELAPTIKDIAEFMRFNGYVLRSGGAPGADVFFEAGADTVKEIYIPWKNFNGSNSTLYNCTDAAMEMAKKFHPKWSCLSEGAKKLMARNCYQILGLELDVPVDLVVCWTPNGGIMGGTGQALRIAKEFNIPVFNLQKEDEVQRLKGFIRSRLF